MTFCETHQSYAFHDKWAGKFYMYTYYSYDNKMTNQLSPFLPCNMKCCSAEVGMLPEALAEVNILT